MPSSSHFLPYESTRRSSPLDIQELVDHCITFLSESNSDLKACALVARCWVHAAQSYLFRAPKVVYNPFTPVLSWRRFYDTLHDSPHLISHIRRLDFRVVDIHPPTLEKICNLPFSHLEAVSIVGEDAEIQQLFSLPTIRCVKLTFSFPQSSSFRKMWERCSPTIRHLELEYHLRSADALLAIPPCVAAVQLSSLRIRSRGRVHYRLTQNLCPFDLSQLNALSIGPGVDVSWQDFAPVVRTIQVLDVAVHGILWQEDKWAIDLAAFPNLLLLRLSLPQPVPRMALATLSTIIPTNRIRTIVISIMSGTDTLDEVGCTQLAATLSTLPMTNSPTVEFEMDFDLHAAALKIFGGINSGEPFPFASTTEETWWGSVIDVC